MHFSRTGKCSARASAGKVCPHDVALLQVLSENAELGSRLIDVALTSDNDLFDAAFGNDVSNDISSIGNGNRSATVPLGHWSQEAAQKRRQEAEEEVCA